MKEKIVVIGAGMMGGAIVKSLLKSGYAGKITATDVQIERLREQEKLGVATSTDNRKAVADSEIVFIAVKPGDVEKVLKGISKEVKDKLVICEEVDEKYMDAITALSGSGPGYLSIIIEALMYAGLKVGLPRNVALYSAAQTVLGTGKLVIELQEHPARIKDMVTTPGGTTIEAIYELEGSQIRQALMRAVEEATKKSQLIREKISINSK